MESVTIITSFILKWLWAPFIAIMGWQYKERKKEAKETEHRFNDIENRLIVVETKYMTEEQVKQITRELLADLKADTASVKNSLAMLQTSIHSLATDLAVSKAVQDAIEQRRYKPYREE